MRLFRRNDAYRGIPRDSNMACYGIDINYIFKKGDLNYEDHN